MKPYYGTRFLVLAVALLLMACGGPERTPTPTPTSTRAPVPTPEKTSVPPGGVQPTQYALRLQVAPTEGGVVEVSPAPEAGDRYPAGAVIKLLASPNQGFVFAFWKIESPAGTSKSKENPLTIIITSDLTITAVFEKGTEKPAQTREMMPVCPPTVGTSPPPLPVLPPSKATGPISLKVVGQVGGPTRAVAVQGNYAYVGVGLRLVALDVADPKAPRELGATEALEWYVQDVTVAGSFAYVAAGGGGLYIASLSNPAQPKVVGRYDTQGYAEGVAVAGRYAYVADGPGGLRILDVSDPAKPAQVAVAYIMNYAFDVALAGNYAYVAAAGAGLLVADVSNPARPAELGRYDTPGYAYGVAVSEDTAYVADGWEGLQVVDVSDPRQPKGVGLYDTPGWAMDVLAARARVYIADAFGGLRVLDASDKAKPTELGSFQVPGGHAAKLALSGGTALVADINLGVHVVDVSSPTQPQRVGLYSPLGWAQAVEVAGGYAYVAGQASGLRVIDLADPAHPREAAAFATENIAVTISVSGNAAYVGTFSPIVASTNRPPSLYAVDITDPLHPKAPPPQPFTGHVGNATFQGGSDISWEGVVGVVPRSTFIQGTTLYVASEWGLLLIDISDPSAPCELGFLQTTPNPMRVDSPIATGVAAAGNLAYLAVFQQGLYIIDVSNPRRPSLLGIFNEQVTFEDTLKKKAATKTLGMVDVVVAKNLAYVLDNEVLRIVDVSDPRWPKGIASFQLPAVPTNGSGSAARSVALDRDQLFVADGAAGLVVVDVSDPSKPKLAGQLRLPGVASWVFLDEKYVYVATGEGGLFVIERSSSPRSNEATTAPQPLVKATQRDDSSFRDSTSFSVAAPIAEVRLAGPEEMAGQPRYQIGGTPENGTPSSSMSVVQAALAAATCTVTSTADSGPGTLRQCLQAANNGDTITFDPNVFPPERPDTIKVLSQLNVGKSNVTIDGSNAGVILDGSSAPTGTTGLYVGGSGNVVKGLQILNFSKNGVGLGGSHNTIGGDRSRGKGPLGEGNLISGNREAGIHVCCGQDATDNRIVGNYIGTDVTGTKALGNLIDGIAMTGHRNVIGGRTPGEGNVISGNGIDEIQMKLSSGNLVVGNYIGTDATGRNKLARAGFSVIIQSGSWNNRIEGNVIAEVLVFIDPGSSYNEAVGNLVGTDATGTVAFEGSSGIWVLRPFNRIGGTRPGEGNVINGMVRVIVPDVVVVGNLIGTDATGKKTLGAATVSLGNGASHNFVGGTTEAERNVINSAGKGMFVSGFASYNFIAGNYIGTDASGAVSLGASGGIALGAADNNYIQSNLISGTQEAGIKLAKGANFNWLRANRITQSDKVGVQITESQGNVIVGNSFTRNGRNASDQGSANRWDDGIEGNYWDDYTGKDNDGDGIGDVPYPVAPNGVDNHPLMKPFEVR